MSNLREIKRRIGSVKSTQKITNAMKLVSASKFTKASHAVISSRPYRSAMEKMLAQVVEGISDDVESPLLKKKTEKKVLMVVVGSDRGLCGGLNSNVIKTVKVWAKEKKAQGIEVAFVGWGKRPSSGIDSIGKVHSKVEKVLEKPTYSKTEKLFKPFLDGFVASEYDAVYTAYPKFISALDQEPTIERQLPFELGSSVSSASSDVIIEPSAGELFDKLLSRQLYTKIFGILLEGAASEHGARMTAMDSATSNAKEVTKKLTLKFNRARQAAITTELTEIISGAESLN